MLLRAVAIFALLLAGTTVAALAADCPPAAAPVPADLFDKPGPKARNRGFLWSVAKDGRTSYLYGTLHLGRMEWLIPGPGVRRALRETDTIALEADVLDTDMQRQSAAVAAKVQRVLPQPLQDRLKAAWAAECLPAEGLAFGPPELQVITLMFFMGRREGLFPDYGSEVALSTFGRSKGRPVISLETAQQQMEALVAKSDEEAQGLLRKSLADIEAGKGPALLAKTARVWETGNMDELLRYEQWCECMETPDERRLMKRVLDDRNPGLARGVDDLHMKGRKVFAGVGAMHMVGPNGLPALLAARGYEVKRLH